MNTVEDVICPWCRQTNDSVPLAYGIVGVALCKKCTKPFKVTTSFVVERLEVKPEEVTVAEV